MFKLNAWNEKENFSASKIAQNVIATACGSDVFRYHNSLWI